MSARKEIDKLMRDARKAGFAVDTSGTSWKVTNPLTGDFTLIVRQPRSGRALVNEKVKLRRIGFVPGETDLRIHTSPHQVPPPLDLSEVPQPEPEPAPEPVAAETTLEEQPVPQISETVRITGKGRNLREDLPTNSWLLWTAIHEGETTDPHELDGVEGVLWRGSLAAKINELWPALPKQDTETRNAVNRYLRATGNMICLKRESRPPLWWLSKTWIETKPDASDHVVPTRTERRLSRAEADENRPAAPVTTRRLSVVAEKENNEVDPLAAITEVVERVKTLEARNLELEHVNEALERENAGLKGQLSRIKAAFRDLSA